MKKYEKTIRLDRAGVDDASETIRGWLEDVGIKNTDVLRIRVTLEELLNNIRVHGEEQIDAVLSFQRRFGIWGLRICYEGERYDPTKPADNETEEFTAAILARTGILPYWRWRNGKNELILRVAGPKPRPEWIMIGCFVAAIVVGYFGRILPEGVKTGITEYALLFLKDGFLNLLNTFIGLLIYLNVVTGICGIGSTAALGRVGKKMMSRFLFITFLISAITTVIVSFVFPLKSGGGMGAPVYAVLKMFFGILPSNPILPFLEGNMLQIVFLGTITGAVLLMMGNHTEDLRKLFSQAQILTLRIMMIVCGLLPVYIFSSLVIQFWSGGGEQMILFWKPLLLTFVLSVLYMVIYLLVTARKLKVKPRALLKLILPNFLIAFSTASSSSTIVPALEICEKKMGIDPAYSGMAYPIGTVLFGSSYTILYVIGPAFLAECYGVNADAGWWATLAILAALISIATPPVPAGNISGISIIMAQLLIPAEGLAIGAALVMIMDFMCTGSRVFLLHLEMLLQADSLDLIDREVLKRETA